MACRGSSIRSRWSQAMQRAATPSTHAPRAEIPPGMLAPVDMITGIRPSPPQRSPRQESESGANASLPWARPTLHETPTLAPNQWFHVEHSDRQRCEATCRSRTATTRAPKPPTRAEPAAPRAPRTVEMRSDPSDPRPPGPLRDVQGTLTEPVLPRWNGRERPPDRHPAAELLEIGHGRRPPARGAVPTPGRSRHTNDHPATSPGQPRSPRTTAATRSMPGSARKCYLF